MVWITSLHDLVAMVCFATCHLVMVPTRMIPFFSSSPHKNSHLPALGFVYYNTSPVFTLSNDQFCKNTNATLEISSAKVSLAH